jgi:hypothetical protein
MRYHDYLASGWPIASGPVEGACKNLIKDRMERSGMRWTEQMAEAIVQLRAIYLSGILIATGNSTSNRTSAAYTPPGPSFQSSHTLIKLDIHASEQDVLTATLAKLQGQEASTGAEKVERLMQQYRGRGLAVAGPLETLEALARGQVEELLISGGLEDGHPRPEEVQAILAPEISDSEGGTKSEEPRQASVPDLLVTKAKQTGARVTFVEDTALLESIGGVGGFLRWRE